MSDSSDYSNYSTPELIERISALERQLREQNARVSSLSGSDSKSTSTPTSTSTTSTSNAAPNPQLRLQSQARPRARSRSASPSRRAQPFDPSRYTTRHIALKFAYLGGRYNGYEHANGNVAPLPTIEEVLWKALCKARLISPPVAEGADQSTDVVWEKDKRLALYTDGKSGGTDEARGKVRLDVNWDACQYSKCGRTDKGVSAFGQVIGIRVRSNRPIEKERRQESESKSSTSTATTDTTPPDGELDDQDALMMPSIDVEDLEAESYAKPFDPIKDELPYANILNAILPPDIRVLAWCPDPPPTFDARFSCRERRYKYFFTNPAFCPTPGPRGLRSTSAVAEGYERQSQIREGWLDIEKMREAAKKLEGLHDFRNLCKIDPSKQMPSCERRITYADIVEWEDTGKMFSSQPALNQTGASSSGLDSASNSNGLNVAALLGNGHAHSSSPSPTVAGVGGASGPKVYAFCVHGSAFLWHQVRCMVAILFLVGQGLEQPSIVDDLLDVEKTPTRPMYEMADDAPLVLWDCIFPDNTDGNGENDMMIDSLNWIYVGDETGLAALGGKGDGKFGPNGIAEDLWGQWREAKMQEVLAGSLLDLVIAQGDGCALTRERGGGRGSQKVFDGGSVARLAGRYVPVMKKPRMDALHVQNARWLNGRKMRRDAKARDAAEAQERTNGAANATAGIPTEQDE
ncbi:hypothetical protein ABEF93_005196 [Exophiala dermatitidis]